VAKAGEIVDAVGRQDFEVALVAAVAMWRASRYAVLADLVDAIAARCKPAAIVGRDKATFQRAWLDRAAVADDDPIATGAVVAGLLLRVPVRDIRYLAKERDVKRQRPFLDRMAALAKIADDPRTASALFGLLAKPPFSVDDVGGVYGPAIDLLVRIGDERSIAKLRALVERPLAKTATIRDYFAEALTDAADQIERKLRKRKPLAEAERAIAAAVLAQLGGGAAAAPAPARSATELERLYAECLAHPADDAPRLVYADALLEQSDAATAARGELIQLQLSGGDAARVASLQRKHEKEWLGDITRVTKLRVFRRGFLDEAELLQGAAADAATWKRVAADPRLATLRVLHKGSASEELYGTFVMSSALRSLCDIEVPSNKLLRELATRPLGKPLQRVTLAAGLTREAFDLMDTVAQRTGVTRLGFETKLSPAALVEQLAGWPALARFEELCAMPHYRAPDWGDDEVWFAFAGVKRIGRGSSRRRTMIVERGKRGLVIEVAATQEWDVRNVFVYKFEQPIERLVITGKPDNWAKPSDELAKTLAKLPATAELVMLEGWAVFRPTLKTDRGRARRARRPSA
jgi:uncharacterized protein (TIGR02996 family)